MLIRNNASNLILRLGQIQTNSVYSMNIGVELLRSYWKSFTFVIPDLIRDPNSWSARTQFIILSQEIPWLRNIFPGMGKNFETVTTFSLFAW